MPEVRGLVASKLTARQQEIVRLYYFCGKTQEEIADELTLTQSTVSRHLFGTVRKGKKIGGAVPKLRKAMDVTDSESIHQALANLRTRFNRASEAA
jgi:DNA-binding transcriptional regulator LsrR (DeoR family)